MIARKLLELEMEKKKNMGMVIKGIIFIAFLVVGVSSCGSLRPGECPTYAGYKSPSGDYYYRLEQHSRQIRKSRNYTYVKAITGGPKWGKKKLKVKITVAAY